jgi:hypothetical protein
MISELRTLISKCDDDEKSVYEALVVEAEGWKMRLEELEEEDE